MLILIQFSILIVLLTGSTLVAWYEGSTLLQKPWEWDYSTPISHILHGGVHSSDQISQVDYFVYAAKFQPAFPIVMVLSSVYIIFLIGYHFFKYRPKLFSYYLSLWGIIFLILNLLIHNSPTVGGQILFYIWSLFAFLSLGIAAILYFRSFNIGKGGTA